MIIIERKEDCCGCSACMAACPVDAIQMTADDEGFQYPQIDMEKCINCGKCDRVCPIKNPVPEIPKEQKAYLFQLKDKKLRMDSTSGGAFTAIASTILREGGVVFGAAYDENLQVIHTYVEEEEDLWRFRNSKYVQSNVQNSFRQVKEFLQQGRKVCFSGTPCQIEGLNSYLKNADERRNLILVDLVCHAVPSPLLWKKYVAWQQKRLGKEIGTIRFRAKRHYGYKYSQMVIEDKEGNVIYHSGVESDPYLRAFFSNLSDRPSCYECKFKKRYRVSDMTIWDCFDVGLKNKSIDDDLGTTSILLHNKGKEELFKNNECGIVNNISVDKCIYGMKELVKSIPKNEKRKEFFQSVTQDDMDEICLKWLPDNRSVKIRRILRAILLKTGLYGVSKRWLMVWRKKVN